MKIILNSLYGSGNWFILRLLEEGHKVDHYTFKENHKKVLQGLIPSNLETFPDYSKYDLSLFDLTGTSNGFSKAAEKSLKECPTIGNSEFCCKLEDDRLFGIEVMEEVGIKVPPYEVFEDLDQAKKFIRKTKKRYVFKPFGDQVSAATYVSSSYEDLLDYLDSLSGIVRGKEEGFILQEVISGGVEVSVEGWFNGEDFHYINGTLEEKKFMNDNLGPNTGCSGNLMWFFKNTPKVFKEGLSKTKEYLKNVGFRGMIDLNSIVKENGDLFGLEWTPRFGYDSSTTLFKLVKNGSLGDLFYSMAAGESSIEGIVSDKFSTGVRVTIPPYPSEIKGEHPEGIPIRGIDENNILSYHLYDAMIQDNKLVTCGEGFSNIVTPVAVGSTIKESWYFSYLLTKNLDIPNMQYRTDLNKCTEERYNCLERQGWFGE